MTQLTDTDLLRAWTLKSSLNFTRYFFKEANGTKFILGKHHKLICDALDDVLNGKCNKLIINISPRYSKCVAPDLRVLTERGLVRADEVVSGDTIYSFQEGKLVKAKCVAVQGGQRKESVRIKMRSGREFTCSHDHPMLTVHGYIEAADLEEGDSIYAYNEYHLHGNGDFYLDKVVSVEPIGMRDDLIDIEVEGTHNFIANGLVSHNTEIAVKNFIAMGLAVNPKANFIHLSYSANLAADNSVAVKNIMQSEEYMRLYQARISGKNQQAQWETDQGGGVYATSTLGQITGFGAGLVREEGKPYTFGGAIIIDDPIKPEDALSDVVRERVNRRFETTIRNRVNDRSTPIIIIMQRLHEHDLCGYLQEIEPEEWRVLSLPVITINEKGEREALWPYKHTLEELDKINNANSFVFETQYMQNPKPMEGLMYPRPFKTYDILPHPKFGVMCNYTDTADTGADYLCSINYFATKDAYYVVDVLFTKKPMEYTEQATAQMLCKDEVRYCSIESNNGGRSFGRNVERLCREYDNRKTTFIPFTQTKNKNVRIFTRSAEVNNMIIFPTDWEHRWPEFASGVKSYRKEGANAHDDHVDVLTGICERGNLVHGASDEQIMADFL